MGLLAVNRIYAAITALVLAFVVLPLGAVIWVSFFANRILSFPATGYTLDWYVRAWQLDSFRNGFITSVETALVAVALSLALGVPASLALVRYRFPGRDAIQTLLLSPMVVPGIVGGAALFMAFIELEILLDVDISGTLPGLFVAHGLIALPWTVRLVTASLVGMSPSYEEAAQSLGAGRLTTFFRVTLPIIKPGIVAAALFSFVISFIDLEKSIFLVGPGRTTLQIALVSYLEWNLDSTVAAVATVQILIIGVLLLVSDRYARLSRAF
ncbi:MULTISPECIES: ABC transporter permease [unclassified Xanthobacter]|uniref:ABC transporter permease n=1 Tax=Xanthobacter TaxID=279 RepID=UPI00145F591F|nr:MULTISPECIES: ABC transporter permease [unclassified Xanthobacter]MBN8914875.1 ABC transporter permease [Hyphomicrobiales bacterium]NMN58788.1 putative spermidine/putrescine transport system permease protein [Xanthobacter sp. SG618]UJX46155.1 ABC transporter permease [Xanthobacter sp. YC-JY1]